MNNEDDDKRSFDNGVVMNAQRKKRSAVEGGRRMTRSATRQRQHKEMELVEGQNQPENDSNIPPVPVMQPPIRWDDYMKTIKVEPIFMMRGREMTDDEMDDYKKMVKASGGFDVGPIRQNINMRDLIRAIFLPKECDRKAVYDDRAKLGLAAYNQKNGTHYEFVRLCLANKCALGRVSIYYLTFYAVDGSPGKNVFLAQVVGGRKEQKDGVAFCKNIGVIE